MSLLQQRVSGMVDIDVRGHLFGESACLCGATSGDWGPGAHMEHLMEAMEPIFESIFRAGADAAVKSIFETDEEDDEEA